jgi:5-methylcytosine-specific restriction endonuclease McrA
LQLQKMDRCQLCGSTEQLEVDHVQPTFNEIYLMARANFLPEEVDSWAYHDWLNNARFSLPEEHPVVWLFDRIHSNSKVQTLCTRCHTWKTRQERRNSL